MLDYDTLIDVATKLEQQIKDENSKVYEPIAFSDVIRNSKKLGLQEALLTVYTMCSEAKQNG